MLFERAEYWEERAHVALLHAKYKEHPDVRWRRIKKIEAALRKAAANDQASFPSKSLDSFQCMRSNPVLLLKLSD